MSRSSPPSRSRPAGSRPAAALALLSVTSLLLAAVPACKGTDGGGGGGGGRARGGVSGISRGPQVALPGTSSIVIAWRTADPVAGGVAYGRSDVASHVIAETVPSASHVFSLEGLEPGTRYLYRLSRGGELVGETHSFRTVPAERDAPIRIAVLGDSGTGSARQREVAAAIRADEPDLVLMTGDVVYERGAPGEIDRAYFEPYAGLVDHIPFYVALGNHDARTRRGSPLLDALYLPFNDADGTERYYSFDRGNVHIVALSSPDDLSPGSEQHEWLRDDLAAAGAADWVIVFFHHPPYSSSRHGSNRSLRASLGPLFDRFGVDLVLNGHDHDYERTYPLRGEEVVDSAQDPDYIDPAGTVYVVTGGGGNTLYPRGKSFFTARSESAHHFVRLDIAGTRLELTAVRTDGSVLDRMTITRTR